MKNLELLVSELCKHTTSAGSISRLIKEAVNKNLIKPLDPTTSNKYMKYIPVWA